jgi:hypothetical protein
MGSADSEPTTKIVLAPSETSGNGGSIPREPAGPPYPRPNCLRLHIRPLGIRSRFADGGLSVFVNQIASALGPFPWLGPFLWDTSERAAVGVC